MEQIGLFCFLPSLLLTFFSLKSLLFLKVTFFPVYVSMLMYIKSHLMFNTELLLTVWAWSLLKWVQVLALCPF